jgi:chemotaxis protein MotB
MKLRMIAGVSLLAAVVAMGGCSNKKLIKQQEQQITDLQTELSAVRGDLEAERARTAQLNAELEDALADMRQKEQVWMQEKEGLTEITLDGEVTFNSASAELTPGGKNILDQIWDVLDRYPDREILIEGHTDNRNLAPTTRDVYRTNWELSSARAHAVLHYVRNKFNTNPDRIGAVGYGEYRPIASNDTAEGRKLNRRVVITVGPMKNASSSQPLP